MPFVPFDVSERRRVSPFPSFSRFLASLWAPVSWSLLVRDFQRGPRAQNVSHPLRIKGTTLNLLTRRGEWFRRLEMEYPFCILKFVVKFGNCFLTIINVATKRIGKATVKLNSK